MLEIMFFQVVIVSGIRGQWTYDKTGPLVLDRPGTMSANGQYVLWPFLSSDKTMTAVVDNDINRYFK